MRAGRTAPARSGAVVVATLVVLAVTVLVIGSLVGASAFAMALALYVIGLLVLCGSVARWGATRRTASVAGASAIAVGVVVLFGATGILTTSDAYRWSALSAMAGIAVGTAIVRFALHRPWEHSRQQGN